jgi:hypothetical protein
MSASQRRRKRAGVNVPSGLADNSPASSAASSPAPTALTGRPRSRATLAAWATMPPRRSATTARTVSRAELGASRQADSHMRE